MKCNECGAIGFNATSCPDCGSSNIVKEAGEDTASQPVSAPVTSTITTSDPGAMPAMPGAVITDVKGPVVGSVMFPVERKAWEVKIEKFELRDGDQFTIARDDSPADVLYRIEKDDTVSSTPIVVTAEDGKGKVTGGGDNGFALDITLRFKPDEIVEVPKTLKAVAELLQRGRFTAVALRAGKTTRFPLKF